MCQNIVLFGPVMFDTPSQASPGNSCLFIQIAAQLSIYLLIDNAKLGLFEQIISPWEPLINKSTSDFLQYIWYNEIYETYSYKYRYYYTTTCFPLVMNTRTLHQLRSISPVTRRPLSLLSSSENPVPVLKKQLASLFGIATARFA